MSLPDLVLRSQNVVLPHGIRPASVHMHAGRITHVGAYHDVPAGGPIVDAGDATILPGAVDTHVHVNEPGRTEWEGFDTATRAAAAGGITTIVDMPLNSIPPATTPRGVATKAEAMERKCWVDVGLWGGAIPANTSGDTRGLANVLKEGALGFKGFLVPSGVDEFPYVTEADVRAAMLQLRDTGATLMIHAELPGPIDQVARERASAAVDVRTYDAYLRSRPPEAEDQAVELLYSLCREIRTPVHIVHLSSAGALGTLSRARDEGLPLTAETAPHYLHFAAEQIPDGATWFKCAPPIRDRANRDRLWAALVDGRISMVVSDHSPCIPDLKRLDTGDFDAAWGGIAGVQFSLSAVWTEARARGIELARVVEWMCAAPARHAGLGGRKGSIVEGADADLVVFAPDESFRVEPARIQHRHKLTPYDGETLFGVVRGTYVRGQRVYDGASFGSAPTGRWIAREGP